MANVSHPGLSSGAFPQSSPLLSPMSAQGMSTLWGTSPATSFHCAFSPTTAHLPASTACSRFGDSTLKLRPSPSSASTLFLCPHLHHSGSSLVLLLFTGLAPCAATGTLGTPNLGQVPSVLVMLPWHHLADSRGQSPYRWPTRPSVTCPYRPSDLVCSHYLGHTGLRPADQACSCLRVLAVALPSAWNVLHVDTTLH